MVEDSKIAAYREKKAAAYRLGLITLGILGVLTLAEFFVAIALQSTVLLLLIALVKAAVIINNFMHIYRLWREEDHE